VVAIPEDSVQPRQVITMALDAARTAVQIGTNVFSADERRYGQPRGPT
jgi:hypothetical protein